MDAHDLEALKGMLLDRWVEDLREDRPPSVMPEMGLLSQQEIADTLGLARWLSAAINSTAPDATESDAIAASVRQRVRREREQQDQALTVAVQQSADFGELMQTARRVRHLRAQDIERSLRLPRGALLRLEAQTIPPHRIAVETMLTLLHALRIATDDVIALIRQAGIEWINRAYTQESTQLGRLDRRVGSDDRRQILTDATANSEQPAQRAEEVERLQKFCDTLAARLH